MLMTSATECLRALLDERGVEWRPIAWNPKKETFYYTSDGVGFCADEYVDGVKIYTDAIISPEQAVAATLGPENVYTREDVEGAFVSGYSLGSLPVGSDPQWDQNEQTVDEHMAELGWVRKDAAAPGETPTPPPPTMPEQPPYDLLIDLLRDEWGIDVSWDGLRRFWYVGLNEKGMRMRDEREDATLGPGTCHAVFEVDAMSEDERIGEFVCSECGETFGDGRYQRPRYCPNCGKKVVD